MNQTNPAQDGSQGEVSAEDYRAYLQRGETRLSTLHRVAGTFISGAGLLTLLPILISTVFSGLLASIVFRRADGLPPPASPERWFALTPALVSMGLPLVALYLLMRDLTQFYFTARPFRTENMGGTYPRFILSGLMLPESGKSDEMQVARLDSFVTNLIVPQKAKYRKSLLKEAHTVGELRRYGVGDDKNRLSEQFRRFLFTESGSEFRTLAGESAKMEASIVRHQRYLRNLVLRYAKAFLLTIVTTIATIVAAGTLALLDQPNSGSAPVVVRPDIIWLSTLSIYALWCVAAAIVVRRPIDWVFAEIDNRSSHQTPPSLRLFERSTVVTIGISMLVLDYSLHRSYSALRLDVRWWPWVIGILGTAGVAFGVLRVLRVESKVAKPTAS
jgi:hypothetical protein